MYFVCGFVMIWSNILMIFMFCVTNLGILVVCMNVCSRMNTMVVVSKDSSMYIVEIEKNIER